MDGEWKTDIEVVECTLDAKRQLLHKVQKDIVDNFKVGDSDNNDKIEDEDKEDDKGSKSTAGSFRAQARRRRRRQHSPIRLSRWHAKKSSKSSIPL
jgi:hypothetical protein